MTTQHRSALGDDPRIDIERFRLTPKDRYGILPTEYRLNALDLDTLPLDTFLIVEEMGAGGYPGTVWRLVKPNNPENYWAPNLTPDSRLLYGFWEAGEAVRKLRRVGAVWPYRYIIQPGDDGFDLLDAFKIVCDTRHARQGKIATNPALLLRAIGWEVPST